MWSLIDILSVGVGGFAGAILRFGLTSATTKWTIATGVPIGTIAVNLIGCFAMGLFAAFADQREIWQSPARSFLAVGLLGGFTTFSAFGHESFALLRSGELGLALLNAGAQLVLGVIAVWLGYALVASR